MTTTMAPGHRQGSRADTWDEENGSHSLVRSVLGLGSNACRGAAAWPVLSKVPFALSILSMTDAALAAVSGRVEHSVFDDLLTRAVDGAMDFQRNCTRMAGT